MGGSCSPFLSGRETWGGQMSRCGWRGVGMAGVTGGEDAILHIYVACMFLAQLIQETNIYEVKQRTQFEGNRGRDFRSMYKRHCFPCEMAATISYNGLMSY